MASAAQVVANRLNAQRSTGPRTPEGKAVVSQNAVKHGLLAQQVVIRGEDPDEFDSFRARMLEELAPQGEVEALLAERVVGLAWRLRRAERLQGTVFDAVYRENAEGPVWPPRELRVQPQPEDGELILGQVVLTDFAHAKVLDRLLVYERRIENSLYRTMAELREHQKSRETDTPTREPTAAEDERGERLSQDLGMPLRGPTRSPDAQRPSGPRPHRGRRSDLNPVGGRLLRYARNDIPTGGSEIVCKSEVSGGKQEVGFEPRTSPFELETPEAASDDTTTNATSQEPAEGGAPNVSAGDLSCETNPIPGSEGRAERPSSSLPEGDQALRPSSTRADCALARQAGFC